MNTEYIWKAKLGILYANYEPKHTNLDIVSEYKYLGLENNGFLHLGITANILSHSTGRATIAKTKNFKDLGFKMYQKLFNRGV